MTKLDDGRGVVDREDRGKARPEASWVDSGQEVGMKFLSEFFLL